MLGFNPHFFFLWFNWPAFNLLWHFWPFLFRNRPLFYIRGLTHWVRCLSVLRSYGYTFRRNFDSRSWIDRIGSFELTVQA